jgi:hypothetical protein
MKTIPEPPKEIPVLYETDVIVVGGGPAGIGAALAATRNGAKTILIDRFGCLGGLQTQCLNSIFTFVDPALHGGIIAEIIDRVKKAKAVKNMDDVPEYEKNRFRRGLIAGFGAEKLPKRILQTDAGYWGTSWGIIFDAEYYKYLLDTMMEEAGVKLLFHAIAVGVMREENSLKGIIIETKDGRQGVLGKVIIDCTGTGHIAWKSGAPCLASEIPAGPRKGKYIGGMLNAFFIGGVDISKFRAFKEKNLEEWGEMYGGRSLIKQAKAKGKFYFRADEVILSTFHDVYDDGRIWVMNAFYPVLADRATRMAEEITNAEIDLRKQAWSIYKLLKEKVPGFERSYVESTPVVPLMSGHRIRGEYVLKIKDMREGKAFEDSVAINNMPPDTYEAVGWFGYCILPHDIPYRCLVSKEIDNLMAAGATISCGPLAHGGLRYTQTSMCTGQATGTAATLAVKHGVSPKELDVKILQDTLREQGARVTVKDVPEEDLEPYRVIQKMKIIFKRSPDIEVREEEVDQY